MSAMSHNLPWETLGEKCINTKKEKIRVINLHLCPKISNSGWRKQTFLEGRYGC